MSGRRTINKTAIKAALINQFLGKIAQELTANSLFLRTHFFLTPICVYASGDRFVTTKVPLSTNRRCAAVSLRSSSPHQSI